ncbi:MAG: hypothetical protein J6U58_07105 [Bacteroidaceae bacterium]|nr:hypothetical protein [Bacteroidaceae bacterium]
MKNIVKKYIGILLLLCVSSISYAQTESLSTGYFLEGNLYRYRLNPAFMGVRGYVAFPAIGNVNMNLASNVGLANFLFPTNDGRLALFLHPDVSADDFNSALNDENKFVTGVDLNIASTAFFAFGGYNTIDLVLHSRLGVSVPRDMFMFMKDMGHEAYNVSDLGVYTKNYIDLSIGHSHKITKDLTIGARLKLLLGVAYAELLMEKMEMQMSDTQWMINAKGHAAVAAGFKFTTDENGVVDAIGDFRPGINGVGFGVDLGATYDLSNVLTKGLIVSASVNDISFMKWNNVSKAGINPESPYVFDGFDALSIGEEGDESGSAFEQIGEDLNDFFAFRDMGVVDKKEMLGATLNVGVEYKMPFYDKMSVGALFSNRFDKLSPFTKGSLMLNISPAKVFDFALSGSVSTYGWNWGAMMNFHCTGFNLFVGAENFIGKVSKQYVPLEKTNTNISFGINFPFVRKR